MYVIAEVWIDCGHGLESFEVGADVECDYRGRYEVGEPDVSAPGSPLKWSRLVNPEASLPEGWSEVVNGALRQAFDYAVEDLSDAAADYAYEAARDCELDES